MPCLRGSERLSCSSYEIKNGPEHAHAPRPDYYSFVQGVLPTSRYHNYRPERCLVGPTRALYQLGVSRGADRPDLHVVDIPAAVEPATVRRTHRPPQIHRTLTVRHGRDVVLHLAPGGIGNLGGVLPNGRPSAAVVAYPQVSVVVPGLLDIQPAPELDRDIGQVGAVDCGFEVRFVSARLLV